MSWWWCFGWVKFRETIFICRHDHRSKLIFYLRRSIRQHSSVLNCHMTRTLSVYISKTIPKLIGIWLTMIGSRWPVPITSNRRWRCFLKKRIIQLSLPVLCNIGNIGDCLVVEIRHQSLQLSPGFRVADRWQGLRLLHLCKKDKRELTVNVKVVSQEGMQDILDCTLSYEYQAVVNNLPASLWVSHLHGPVLISYSYMSGSLSLGVAMQIDL